jgi:hypothetical protein
MDGASFIKYAESKARKSSKQIECDNIVKLSTKKDKKPSLVFLGDKKSEAFHVFHES